MNSVQSMTCRSGNVVTELTTLAVVKILHSGAACEVFIPCSVLCLDCPASGTKRGISSKDLLSAICYQVEING